MYCFQCGAPTQEGVRFCAQCGTSQSHTGGDQATYSVPTPATPTAEYKQSEFSAEERLRFYRQFTTRMWWWAFGGIAALFATVMLWGLASLLSEINGRSAFADVINTLVPLIIALAVLATLAGVPVAFHYAGRRAEIMLETYDARSGAGSFAQVPPQIRGWSWGGAVLSILWGSRNAVWISFFALIPYIGALVMFFVLGINGHRYAWQGRRWKNVDEFIQVQRRWNTVGLVIFALNIAIIVFAIMLSL